MPEPLTNPRRVAILLAAYNGSRFIREQLDSILGQTFADFTLYVRDDGSSDDTVRIVRSYVERDDRVCLLEDPVLHRGSSGSFFAMLDAVDSELYMFSDQDDVWQPEKISRSVEAYERVKPRYADLTILASSSTSSPSASEQMLPSWSTAGSGP